MKIKKIHALQIINSRAIPTLKTTVCLNNGICASASVPQGASTGQHEAKELRDQDPNWFAGFSVGRNIRLIEEKIAPALKGLKITDQEKIDQTLIELDGTKDKSRLGANTILSVSLACARAGAKSQQKELFEYLGEIARNQKLSLPTPLLNFINGGKHAQNALDIQEFLVIPKAKTFFEAIEIGAQIYLELKKQLQTKGLSVGLGDEGGFAPNLNSNREALALLEETIKNVAPNKAFLGLDVAANSFYNSQDQTYILEDASLGAEQLLNYLKEITQEFNVKSIEDPLAETDVDGWQKVKPELSDVQIVGDDLFVTNPERIQRFAHLATAAIIKPNQIGTLTETLQAIKAARANNLKIIISHRSGETEDTFIADLAVGVGADEIKAGSLARSERVAKYNRLLEIEQQFNLPYNSAL